MTTPAPSRRVAILAPMRPELRPLVRSLSLSRRRSDDGALISGVVGRVEVVATTTGIGTRAAARTAERVLDFTSIDHLIVVGIAGAIGPSVDIGDLVVPDLVIDLSTGTEHRPTLLGSTAPRGTLVTLDELLVDQDDLVRLEQQGVIAVDMETAAVCEDRHCPWSVFRAISDRADDGSSDPALFDLAGPDGGPNFPALARFVLSKPWRVPKLARLARSMKHATNTAASAAVSALEKM